MADRLTLPPLPEPEGFAHKGALADMKAGRYWAATLVSREAAYVVSDEWFDADVPMFTADQLHARDAEVWRCAMEAAAKEPTADEIRLAAGELSAQEMRAVRAVLRWRCAALRALPVPQQETPE